MLVMMVQWIMLVIIIHLTMITSIMVKWIMMLVHEDYQRGMKKYFSFTYDHNLKV